MGTHSLIVMRFKRNNNYDVYCKLYQQFDGYLNGVGKTLIDFLLSITLVNGITGEGNEANGAGCLFAQIIKLFKKRVGGSYIVDPNSNHEEAYMYYVDVDENSRTMEIGIEEDGGISFRGSLEQASQLINPPN